jgi:hypothetical protein
VFGVLFCKQSFLAQSLGILHHHHHHHHHRCSFSVCLLHLFAVPCHKF